VWGGLAERTAAGSATPPYTPKTGRREPEKIWKTLSREKRLFSRLNPLKTLKTAKEMFAKIWRKQAEI